MIQGMGKKWEITRLKTREVQWPHNVEVMFLIM